MKALYYPFIQVQDISWLYGSLLFWDQISTMTPNVEIPYCDSATQYLFGEGYLIPYRARPDREEVAQASEIIAGILQSSEMRRILGEDHWLSHQSSGGTPVHPDKIESNLRYELKELGLAIDRKDGYLGMHNGLASAYIHALAGQVAAFDGQSLVTDQIGSHAFCERIRYQRSIDSLQQEQQSRPRSFLNSEIVSSCVSEMMLSWFRIDPETDPKKLVRFKRSQRNSKR